MYRFHFLAVVAVLAAAPLESSACPFCSAVSQTFSEEMSTMDVVAIVRLDAAASITDLNTSDASAEVPRSRFRIVQVMKGAEFVKPGQFFETIYFGEASKEKAFLATATDAPNLMWSTPLVLTSRAQQYLLKLSSLPATAERLDFFQEYLEDEDEMLARDAYDEFAKAPYKDVLALKERMDRGRLLDFVQDPDVPSNRRRLYFTMLGVCGREEDAVLLEKMMASEDRKQKAGLDALLACYLILKKEAGLQRVDELFLASGQAEYADTYAAIMAIRFHGSEVDVIPKDRLTQSLRLMLDRPDLADLVIPDLARWEDWEVMPRLVKLFRDADENSSWVRVPVVNYLRACPLPRAKQYIEELKAVDADAVKRAMTYFPLDAPPAAGAADQGVSPNATPSPAASGRVMPKTSSSSLLAAVSSDRLSAWEDRPAPTTPAETNSTDAPAPAARPRVAVEESVASMSRTPATLNQAEMLAQQGANLWLLFGVTMGSSGVLFVAMRSILGSGQA